MILILASGRPTSGLTGFARELSMYRPHGLLVCYNGSKVIHLDGKEVTVIEYESRGGHYMLCEKKDLAAFVDFPLNKILTTADPEYLKAHYQEMMEPFKDRLSCMFTGRFYFEFTARGIDKAKALDAVLSPMGYSPKELIAFGDGQNDASMLAYAGRGVAMANGVEELKAKADQVTASNDEDGIGLVIERLLEESGRSV